MRKIISIQDIPSVAAIIDKPVFLTTGCFDLLHVNHIGWLMESSRLAKMVDGLLFVGVCDDETIRRNKPVVDDVPRPYIPQNERARLIASMPFVFKVILNQFEEHGDTVPYAKLVKMLRPDYWILPDESMFPEKKKLLSDLGITPIIRPRIQKTVGLSTTSIMCSLAS